MPEDKPESYLDTLAEIETQANEVLPDEPRPEQLAEVMASENIEPAAGASEFEPDGENLPAPIEGIGESIDDLESRLDELPNSEDADRISHTIHATWSNLRLVYRDYRDKKIDAAGLDGAIYSAQRMVDLMRADFASKIPGHPADTEPDE